MRKLQYFSILFLFALWPLGPAWANVSSKSMISGADKRKLIVEQINEGISKEFKIKFKWSVKDADPMDKGDSQSSSRRPPSQNKSAISYGKMSSGEAKVQAMLEKQRAKLKKHSKTLLKNASSSKSNSKDWMSSKVHSSKQWMNSKIAQQNEWQEKKLKVLRAWEESRKQFKRDLPEFKEDLTDLSDFSKPTIKVTKAIPEAHTPIVNQYSMSLVEEDFDLPIRSQGKRSTCSAFAAVRAMEILAMKKGRSIDLSEQYFYFASKPKCQKSPCTKKGSWPEPGFSSSIPLEKACPYFPNEKGRNETQIPMKSGCRAGRAKVRKYSHAKTRNEIQASLRKGFPVVGGFKLNEAFYKNEGYVFLKGEADEGMILGDKHAKGHALILIGVMDLPKELWSKQGKHCTLVANSWGEGWAMGGYACLSDAWFDQYRYQFPFLVVQDITLR